MHALVSARFQRLIHICPLHDGLQALGDDVLHRIGIQTIVHRRRLLRPCSKVLVNTLATKKAFGSPQCFKSFADFIVLPD